MMRGGRETKDKGKEGINNCGWSRMMRGGRETKDKKKGALTIVDGAE
jgi:hypothetical protein